MIINNSELLNTGGGCMVLHISVSGHAEIKSITINEEAIVAWSTPQDLMIFDLYDLIWETDDWMDIRNYFDEKTSAAIHQLWNDSWKWFDHKKNNSVGDEF